MTKDEAIAVLVKAWASAILLPDSACSSAQYDELVQAIKVLENG